MRTIAVVTVGRSDYGILQPVLRALRADDRFGVQVIAGGAHGVGDADDALSVDAPEGSTITRVEMLLAADTPSAIAKSLGLGVMGFADAYQHVQPGLVLLVGDRFETFAAAAAALPLTLPLAHIHGGEISEGAIDEQIRHAITKMSHLHFASTRRSADRIVQMGEEPWRVTVTGAPALDNVLAMPRLDRHTLEARIGIALTPDPLIVTFHSPTLEVQDTQRQIRELTAALASVDRPVVITHPNADTANQTVLRELKAFAAGRAGVALVASLESQAYYSLMGCAAAMVGNSSSGIIEAPSFRLPVVNVGNRQAGRERSANIIDVECTRDGILAGIRTAMSDDFIRSLTGLKNPYGDGDAARRIADVLGSVPLDRRLITKRFQLCTAN